MFVNLVGLRYLKKIVKTYIIVTRKKSCQRNKYLFYQHIPCNTDFPATNDLCDFCRKNGQSSMTLESKVPDNRCCTCINFKIVYLFKNISCQDINKILITIYSFLFCVCPLSVISFIQVLTNRISHSW